MKAHKTSITAIFFLAILFDGCLHSTNGPIDQQAVEIQISEIRNIIWRLQKFNKNGVEQNISLYPPFHLIYDEAQFFGDDGCNWFGGVYVIENNTVHPDSVKQTLRLCLRATFPIQHLLEPYQINIDENELKILSGNNAYTYRSDFSEKTDIGVLAQNWILSESTDSEFETIQSQQLTPSLNLTQDRGFKIIWFCNSENPGECNQTTGVFGIGKDSKIIFYQKSNSNNGHGENFVHRILASSSYRLELEIPKGGKLTLFNENQNTKYVFTTLTR